MDNRVWGLYTLDASPKEAKELAEALTVSRKISTGFTLLPVAYKIRDSANSEIWYYLDNVFLTQKKARKAGMKGNSLFRIRPMAAIPTKYY